MQSQEIQFRYGFNRWVPIKKVKRHCTSAASHSNQKNYPILTIKTKSLVKAHRSLTESFLTVELAKKSIPARPTLRREACRIAVRRRGTLSTLLFFAVVYRSTLPGITALLMMSKRSNGIAGSLFMELARKYSPPGIEVTATECANRF